jgi:hypothetical protein
VAAPQEGRFHFRLLHFPNHALYPCATLVIEWDCDFAILIRDYASLNWLAELFFNQQTIDGKLSNMALVWAVRGTC